MAKVSVIGTTSWGTTLAIILANNGADVLLWARTGEEAQALEGPRENLGLLPGASFPSSMHVTASERDAAAGADMVVVAVPSRSFRENVRRFLPFWDRPCVVVSATKGLEMDTAKRMSQILEEELPEAFRPGISALSGPNLSREVVQGRPTSTVVASRDGGSALQAQELFMSSTFRVYTNTDVVGVELGGALKNIVALGAGISDGLGYGDNGKAAFITRGLAEITRLGVAAGAEPRTFAGLAGLGDLVATCSSPLSRNHYVGEQLAAGEKLDEILSSMRNVAEGVYTTVGALKLASGLGVEMPIAEATNRVLFQGLDPRQAVLELMARAPGPEWPWVQP